MDKELESKTHRLIRMVFQDVYAAYYARPDLWRAVPPASISVGNWRFNLGECNAGTLQIICAGIETFGRALLGYTVERNVSGESFTSFIETYFPGAYKGKGQEAYSCYRCGLLHSHYLGFSSADGFFPSRNGRSLSTSHLQYADLSGTSAAPIRDPKHFRLILNIDAFANDFKVAVEAYLNDLRSGVTKQVSGKAVNLVGNLKSSLKDFPLEDKDLLDLPGRDPGSVTFGDTTIAATSPSYPLPPKP